MGVRQDLREQLRGAHQPVLSNVAARRPSRVVEDLDAVPEGDGVEDSLRIERVESGVLWFEGGIGPLKVPGEVSAVAEVGRSVTVVLAPVRGVWHVVEVGNVYP
ncbi:MAG: hypothetical protein ACLP01_12570 [Solirubrobacteraceae bacterium]